MLGPRAQQIRRAQQAPDMVGAERGCGIAFHDYPPSPPIKSTPSPAALRSAPSPVVQERGYSAQSSSPAPRGAVRGSSSASYRCSGMARTSFLRPPGLCLARLPRGASNDITVSLRGAERRSNLAAVSPAQGGSSVVRSSLFTTDFSLPDRPARRGGGGTKPAGLGG